MASYLQAPDYTIYQTTPFALPSDNINRALMYKQSSYDQNIARINSQGNDMLNLDITNAENKQRVAEFSERAKKQLNSLATADFSLQDNVNAAMKIFEPLTTDKYVLNDVATTKHFRSQVAVAEDLRTKNKGEGFSTTNLQYVQNSWDKFINAKGTEQLSVDKRVYKPYVNVMAEINKAAKDMGVEVTQDRQAPGGYIIRRKNGQLIEGPLREVFYSNLSQQAREQLDIEATVAYENSERILGADAAAKSVISTYQETLNTNMLEYDYKISKNMSYIKDIESLGNNATTQQLERLEELRSINKTYESSKTATKRELENMAQWDPSRLPTYAMEISKNLYVNTKASNWARSMAYATESYELKTDEPYWKNLEYNIRVLEAQNKAAAASKKESDGSSTSSANSPTPIGGDKIADEGIQSFKDLTGKVVEARQEIASTKAKYQDQYWDAKAEGNSNTYSVVQKAIMNNQDGLTLSQIVNYYNTDSDLNNNINIDGYARALNLSRDRVASMTMREIYDRMESDFYNYVQDSSSIPNGDINVYKFKADIARAEDYSKFWDKAYKDASAKSFREAGELKLVSGVINTKDFFTQDGVILSKEQAVNKVRNKLASTEVVLTQEERDKIFNSLSPSERKLPNGVTLTTAPKRQIVLNKRGRSQVLNEDGQWPEAELKPASKYATSDDFLVSKSVEKAYDDYFKSIQKNLDDAAKSISQNVVYPRFKLTNSDKEDLTDTLADKLLYNLQGTNIANTNFTESDWGLIKTLQGGANDLVSGIEFTTRPNNRNSYTIRFDPTALAKRISKEGATYAKLMSEGLVLKDVPNIPELDVKGDYSRFLVDNNMPIERNFSENYSFKVFKLNSPQGQVYRIKGTALKPKVDANNRLVTDENGIVFIPEAISEDIPTDRNLDDAIEAISSRFQLFNAGYIFANTLVGKDRLNPNSARAILTPEQLSAAVLEHYKLSR